MKNVRILKILLLVTGFLLIIFSSLLSTAYSRVGGESMQALLANVFAPKYNVKISQTVPGTFTFNYKIGEIREIPNENLFDVPIIPFNDADARKELGRGYENFDFGKIRDAWNYPIKENVYQKLSKIKNKKSEVSVSLLNLVSPQKALANDVVSGTPGLVNCRANTNVTGYFKAYFEEVALNTTNGFYNDPTYGQIRRDKACQVLRDIATMLKMDQTNVTPDILFAANPGLDSGVLAAASAYFGYETNGVDNGAVHKYIISRQDPTPSTGFFDAIVYTNSNKPWDDVSLNANTYSLYTVLEHEIFHALGFLSLLPANITSTNDIHPHSTFDTFIFSDDTFSHPFFNSTNGFLQAPIGNPSSWFTTNLVSYRGVKNIFNATPDGTRAIYSPNPYEYGSSISHFDMNRGGKVYVMNPSMGPNTVRQVHNDEKEVLCHLGYQVLGMTGCESPTPNPTDDSKSIITNSVCLNILSNDTSFDGGNLVINSFVSLSVESGDSVTFYLNNNCAGAASSIASGSKSIRFSRTNLQSNLLRQYSYLIRNTNSGRISFNPALVFIATCDPSTLGNYVCNGNFETKQIKSNYGPNQAAFLCEAGWNPASAVPFWCQSAGTPDIAEYGQSSGYQELPYDCSTYAQPGCMVNTPDNSSKAGFTWSTSTYTLDGHFYPNNIEEGILSQLKTPLISGEQYKISFDVLAFTSAEGTTFNNPNLITATKVIAKLNSTPNMTNYFLNTTPFAQTILSQNISFNVPTNQWTHVEQIFTPTSNYSFLGLNSEVIGSGNYHEIFTYWDNIVITKVTANIAPTVNIDCNGHPTCDVVNGSSANINWSSNNASTCIVSPDNWNGISGTHSTGNLTATKIYSVDCVSVNGQHATATTTAYVKPLDPKVDIKCNGADSCLAKNGKSVTVSWNSSGVSSCVIDPDGITGVSGSFNTGALISSKTYTANCISDQGLTVTDSVKITTVTVIDEVKEIGIPLPIIKKDTITQTILPAISSSFRK